MTNGENWNDALKMIDEAKPAWLTTAIDMGIAIPEPQLVVRTLPTRSYLQIDSCSMLATFVLC
jgi:hypothetical protein